MKNIEYRTPNVEGKEELFIAFKVFYFHPSTFDIQKTKPFGSDYAGLVTSLGFCFLCIFVEDKNNFFFIFC
jgi:hypothetical protein